MHRLIALTASLAALVLLAPGAYDDASGVTLVEVYSLYRGSGNTAPSAVRRLR